jgi:integrase
MAHLSAALAYAVKWEMLAKVPSISRPKRAKGSKVMKGRPITTEEFERMLGKVASVVTANSAPSWTFYLRGLWASGLRLTESLQLFWDRQEKLCVDRTGNRPMLWIPAALQKSNEDTLLPMAPEFAEFLMTIPEAERTGPVFSPLGKMGKPMGPGRVSRTICDIGEAAGVVVNRATKTTEGKETQVIKYASAHDLRRAFGERWAPRVMPQVLMELMRHKAISTTLKYYVGSDAQKTAAILWQAHEASGNTLGNTSESSERENAEFPGK